ncbi:MmpS family transport accessory protein [Mycolicibacterium mengxianglii]|uniref:MmpS family transport accessory protein n=1 Tax=Mycolicibacterium mengxianglii TaxID=2736649 RepID=UPI0018D1DF1C|nr:MmpS family transport accessory protein [Mycolicibacterium mengxianglii]
MPILKLLARVWLPLVVVSVVGVAGYAVTRLHGAFGAEQHPSYAESRLVDTGAVGTKQLVYEVFGPAGAVADISYFDVDSTPQQVGGASLPWSLTLTSASSGSIGSLVAQGNSDSIGCRILVDGEVRAEKISNQVNAFTYCLVTGI